MAETCIVCLGDLVPPDSEPPQAVDPLDGADTDQHPSNAQRVALPAPVPASSDDEMVAHLLPCGHNLHNECLKPWVERANSCPICRASFNMVELSAKIGGPTISSYVVQDKQQVAELDPSLIIEEDYVEDDGSYDACMVCDEFGDASQLMYCHSCEQLCHVFCAGLDRMPSRGAWYCQGCMENPELLSGAQQRARPRGPAAFANGRNRVPRRAGAPDEWIGVWQSVWSRLNFDLDFPYDEDEQSDSRSEVQRRENEEWERRFQLARQLGAGNRFRAATDNIYLRSLPGNRIRHASGALHHEAPKTPKDPESQEELRAWNQFEKAREQVAQVDSEVAPASNSNSRRRKRKSADSSPAETELQEDPEPARKLKRPRTRLNVDAGESSAAAARHPSVPEHVVSSPGIMRDGSESVNTSGFLQALLQEVAVDRSAKEEREIAAPQPKRVIIDRACSPQNSSPGLSPVYHAPHGMITPPPLILNPSNPLLIDDAQLSPTYSPYSPADDDTRRGRKELAIRSPHSPPRSKDSSPSCASLSYSTKRELQRMVTVVLKPLYLKKEITKEEYTCINRDVSRLLYERVGDAGAEALANQETRARWQQMAGDEVSIAVKAYRADNPTAASAVDDAASSSS